MMGKTIWAAALALGIMLAVPHAPGHAAPASLTLQLSAAQAHAALLRAFSERDASQEIRRRYRVLLPFGSPLFPPDTDIADPPATPDSASGFSLAQWRSLPPAARRYDVLLAPDIDYYWKSGATDFSCQFIVHLQPLGPASVTLHLLQVHPTVRLGKKFDLLGRTGPGFYWDIRAAPPSSQASAELLAFLTAALAKQQ